MSKQGMKRPDTVKLHPKNEFPPVPELKVWQETPISPVYPAIDTDLARDNLENDLTFADLQDL